LYSLRNITAPPETPEQVQSILSSLSATVTTTLPNFLVPTPTFTIPAYIFNTSVSRLNSGIARTGLATSTYEPILSLAAKASAILPGVTPSPTLATFIMTDSAGMVVTSTSRYAQPTLGVPPGWNAGSVTQTSFVFAIIPGLAIAWLLTFLTDLIMN
jgi:hypothetical protein